MNSNPTLEEVKRKYNRLPLCREWLEFPMEFLFFRRWRKRFLPPLKGKVLEVGVGTGKNIPYYNYQQVTLTAVDVSSGVMKRAEKRMQEKNHPVNLVLLPSDNLPYPNNTFDIVICTFVLCSVPDQMRMLRELKRVVKKEGKIILIEHMLSKNKIIAFLEKIHNPLFNYLLGFNINRDTKGNIQNAGLKITEEENLAFYDVFRYLEVRK